MLEYVGCTTSGSQKKKKNCSKTLTTEGRLRKLGLARTITPTASIVTEPRTVTTATAATTATTAMTATTATTATTQL